MPASPRTTFFICKNKEERLLLAKEYWIWQIAGPHSQAVYTDLHLLRVWPVCWNIKLSSVMSRTRVLPLVITALGIICWLRRSGGFPLSVLPFYLELSQAAAGMRSGWRISLLNPLCMLFFTCQQKKLCDLLDWLGFSELHLLNKSKANGNVISDHCGREHSYWFGNFYSIFLTYLQRYISSSFWGFSEFQRQFCWSAGGFGICWLGLFGFFPINQIESWYN